MWELDHKEGWAPKNWCFWTVMLEKTLESSLDWKEIQPVNPKGNQSWIFTGRTDAEAPVLWPTDVKSWLIRKYPAWFWEILRAEGKEDDRRRDVWMASLTQWPWVWASSRRWWRTGKPGVLQSMGSQSQTRLSDWTIIDLECCVNFKCTAKVICYTNTFIYIPFFRLFSPIGHYRVLSRDPCAVAGPY